MTGAGTIQRVDQWLWFARVAKSRTLAQALVARGKVRLNRSKIDKPSAAVKPGDVLTVTLGPQVRILEILAIGMRRGPATEAQQLFRDLSPAPARTGSGARTPAEMAAAQPQAVRSDGAGRPTKRERRLTDKLKDRYGPL
jgi:ribosome-associated heat shock protein Hsp15